MSADNIVGFSIRIGADELERLKVLAAREHRSVNQQVRKFIVSGLEEAEQTEQQAA